MKSLVLMPLIATDTFLLIRSNVESKSTRCVRLTCCILDVCLFKHPFNNSFVILKKKTGAGHDLYYIFNSVEHNRDVFPAIVVEI